MFNQLFKFIVKLKKIFGVLINLLSNIGQSNFDVFDLLGIETFYGYNSYL